MKRFLSQPLYDLFRKLIRNPKYRWAILAGGLFYLLSPLDISPDVIPVVGWLDDGVIATLLVTEISQMLLDRRRSQKSEQVVTTAEPLNTNQSMANQTIDVKATV